MEIPWVVHWGEVVEEAFCLICINNKEQCYGLTMRNFLCLSFWISNVYVFRKAMLCDYVGRMIFWFVSEIYG